MFEMTKDAEEAVNHLKKSITKCVGLCHRSPNSSTFQLVTDASLKAVGAALHQVIDGKPHPIGFFSKKLSASQTTYSVFDRELLAAYQAVLHFKANIEGQNVTLWTDHKPLTSAFFSRNLAKSDRQQRHLGVLTELLTDCQYIKGEENVVADALSRSVNLIQSDMINLEKNGRCTDE